MLRYSFDAYLILRHIQPPLYALMPPSRCRYDDADFSPYHMPPSFFAADTPSLFILSFATPLFPLSFISICCRFQLFFYICRYYVMVTFRYCCHAAMLLPSRADDISPFFAAASSLPLSFIFFALMSLF